MAPPLRPVTRQLAKKIPDKNPNLQEAPCDLFSLLALLSAASPPEPTEPRNYKEVVSERNERRRDWKQAI